jgi:hypothetical protein
MGRSLRHFRHFAILAPQVHRFILMLVGRSRIGYYYLYILIQAQNSADTAPVHSAGQMV